MNKKHILDKNGEHFEDKEAHGAGFAEEMMKVTNSILGDDIKNRTLEASRDIQQIKFPVDMEFNDDLFMFEPCQVQKKPGLEYAELKDSELFDKMFFEHPYKGIVVMVGRIKSRKLRVKPGDVIYYDPSLKHNTFLYQDKKYLVGSVPMIISIAKYKKETLLTKLLRRIKG